MQQHIIDKVTMEIGLKRSREAFDFQNKCSHLMHESLMTVIENICDQISDNNEHVTIDKLEVSLGGLSRSNFEWDLVEKFQQEFSSTLTEHAKRTESNVLSGNILSDRDLSNHRSEYHKDSLNHEQNSVEIQNYYWQIIEHYLTSGMLPWFAKVENFPGIEKALSAVLNDDILQNTSTNEKLTTQNVDHKNSYKPLIDLSKAKLSPRNIEKRLKQLLLSSNNLNRFLSQVNEASVSQIYLTLFRSDLDLVALFDLFDKIDMTASGLKNEPPELASTTSPISGISIRIPARIDLWNIVWQQSLQTTAQKNHIQETSTQEMLFVQLWHSLVKQNNLQPLLVINGLIQNQAEFAKVKGVNKSAMENSLEQVKANYLDVGTTLKKPPYSILEDMSSIENQSTLSTNGEKDSHLKERQNRQLSDKFLSDKHPHQTNNDLNRHQKEERKESEIENDIESDSKVPKSGQISEEKDKENKQHLQGVTQDPEKQYLERQDIEKRDIDKVKIVSSQHSKPNLSNQITREEKPIDAETHQLKDKDEKPPKLSATEDISPEIFLERIPVSNAGLIIFWPYLQIYFNDLGLLDKQSFKNEQAQQKALHLLQYLATGEEQTEEFNFVLNKLLCNWDLTKPVNRFISLSKRDKQESDKLINAVIENWAILGKTSPHNLRQTFVLRKGILQKDGGDWLLRVEKGPYDVLIEQIPWGLSMIKLSWMDTLLRVEW
ncbi:contractile injection system tape measure protein [Aliikangiella coralliicola]|uniref:Uncharacterized protein n=1 Tax=Aliikangiella coralliicola TaxID=2592383 RepID=A0A545UD88_9GAMM|nr:contractile injection system tape measure protein [Aliikangiella coralliicola]TQV87428.1 hypothetical protein FLL46_13370 [Aliikangiella coralliicola]